MAAPIPGRAENDRFMPDLAFDYLYARLFLGMLHWANDLWRMKSKYSNLIAGVLFNADGRRNHIAEASP